MGKAIKFSRLGETKTVDTKGGDAPFTTGGSLLGTLKNRVAWRYIGIADCSDLERFEAIVMVFTEH